MDTHTPVLDVIRAAALADPGKPAVLDSAGVTYSYGGFLAAVEISARWLRENQARPPMVLVPGDTPHDVVALFAAMSAGCVPLIADKTWTRDEIVRMARTTGARYVLASESSSLRAQEPAPWPTLGWTDLGPAQGNERLTGIGFGRFAARCLGFTQTSAVNAAKAWRRGLALTRDDVVLSLAPINNDTSLLSVFAAGATLALHAGRPQPTSFARTLRRVRPTVLRAAPSTLASLTPQGVDVRLVLSSPGTSWHGAPVRDCYGSPEAGPIAVDGDLMDGVDVEIGPDRRILVRTRAMASKYVDDLEPGFGDRLTADGFLRSRDFGRITPDGKLLLERNDHARRGGPVHR